MYFVAPPYIITKPSKYWKIIQKIGEELLTQIKDIPPRKVHVFMWPKTSTKISTHPGNKKKVPLFKDPLAPYSQTPRMVMKKLYELVGKNAYLIVLGGIPPLMALESENGKRDSLKLVEPLRDFYRPFSNVAGLSVSKAKKYGKTS